MKYRKIVSWTYIINIAVQSIVTLVMPAAIFFLVAMFFVKKLSAPEWIYAIVIPVGLIFGFVAMVKFVISAMRGLEALEKQHKEKDSKSK